jgi:hypothetical protein
MLAQMDSHNLKSLFLGKLVDTGLLFERLQKQAGYLDMNYDATESLFPSELQGEEQEEEEEFENPICTPFADDFLMGLLRPILMLSFRNANMPLPIGLMVPSPILKSLVSG